jgi:hypothetical protein
LIKKIKLLNPGIFDNPNQKIETLQIKAEKEPITFGINTKNLNTNEENSKSMPTKTFDDDNLELIKVNFKISKTLQILNNQNMKGNGKKELCLFGKV